MLLNDELMRQIKKKKKSKMPFRAMHARAQGRTGLQWVMADKRLEPELIKILEESKMPHKTW